MEYFIAYTTVTIIGLIWFSKNSQPKETGLQRALREIEAEIEEKRRMYPQFRNI